MQVRLKCSCMRGVFLRLITQVHSEAEPREATELKFK